MAEFILAIVGVVVAGPGIAVSLAQCGEYLENLAKKFSNASEAVREIARFGQQLYNGKLKVDLELAEWAYSAGRVDDDLKHLIEDVINQLKNSLMTAASTLDNFIDRQGGVRRTYFALFGERRASRVLGELRQWQAEFESIIDLVDKRVRLVPDQLLLSRQKFRIIHSSTGQDLTEIAGSSNLVGKCEYQNQGIEEFQCLIERQMTIEDADRTEVKELAQILASKLCKNSSSVGVLQCLGYRETPSFELVFRLPEQVTGLQTLESAMKTSPSTIQHGCPLQERQRLCREMCEAIVRVHTSGLVHKNIRANTVLLIKHGSPTMLSPSNSPISNTLGTAYLTDWYMLRQMTDLSSRRGTDDWKEDVYRHPRRQGRQPEERYHIGHDIYSLGVVLSEIVLWETFIDPSNSPPLSSLYQNTVERNKLVSVSDLSRLEKLTAPLVVKKVLTTIVQTELASRIGSPAADFIVACLTCLEGGMAGLTEQQFKTTPNVVALRFREMYMQVFPSL